MINKILFCAVFGVAVSTVCFADSALISCPNVRGVDVAQGEKLRPFQSNNVTWSFTQPCSDYGFDNEEYCVSSTSVNISPNEPSQTVNTVTLPQPPAAAAYLPCQGVDSHGTAYSVATKIPCHYCGSVDVTKVGATQYLATWTESTKK